MPLIFILGYFANEGVGGDPPTLHPDISGKTLSLLNIFFIITYIKKQKFQVIKISDNNSEKTFPKIIQPKTLLNLKKCFH